MPLDILLINPPFLTLTSRLGVGHQVPLGLLMVGGALIDAGFSVQLLDAEVQHLPLSDILSTVRALKPRIIMAGHAGSTPAHTTCLKMFRALKKRIPNLIIIYGGPYPTYHAREILHAHSEVDVIVRGEGEATAVALVRAMEEGTALAQVASIAFRGEGDTQVTLTPERAPLNMNHYRIAWELLDQNNSWDLYQCFGLGRAVIVQFSRGCPHQCTYCGQRGFWMQWRHRDPLALADEIEWLVKKRGVRFITLADENPTTLRPAWETFLKEIIRRKLPVKFFATIRATDIVRDRDSLHLWRAAGIQYILLGIDGTDEATLKAIKKGSTTRIDYQACQLLRTHGIYSMTARIVGLTEQRWTDFFQIARQLALYDGDYLNVMYVTPHSWTAFAQQSRDRLVVDERLSHWTYRWPVLGQPHMKPWELFTAVKLLELWFHLRPTRLWRLLTQNAFSRQQFLWCLTHIGVVWVAEITEFLRQPPQGRNRTLAQFYNLPIGELRHEERIALRIHKTRNISEGPPRIPFQKNLLVPKTAAIPSTMTR